ncbi:MAG: hypothetical protein AB9835_04470 [Eubacteriales bacterium]
MLIHCSESCEHQQYGYCSLKDTYAASTVLPSAEASIKGCVYYRPVTKHKDNAISQGAAQPPTAPLQG